MDIRKEFSNWLSKKTKKNGALMSDSTVYKYVRAIDTISEDMVRENIISGNIYNIIDKSQIIKTIVLIKNNNNFNLKNDTGNNMYSVALAHYQDYISNK